MYEYVVYYIHLRYVMIKNTIHNTEHNPKAGGKCMEWMIFLPSGHLSSKHPVSQASQVWYRVIGIDISWWVHSSLRTRWDAKHGNDIIFSWRQASPRLLKEWIPRWRIKLLWTQNIAIHKVPTFSTNHPPGGRRVVWNCQYAELMSLV